MMKLLRSPFALFGVGVLLVCALALAFIPDLLRALVSPGAFMPHRHCYLDNPAMLWLQGLSDSVIGASYMAIAGALAYLVWKAWKDIPFKWLFLAFGLFIFSCGWTHFMEVWTLWRPVYWLSGMIKAATAAASIATAFGFFFVLPHALGLIETAKASVLRNLADRQRAEEQVRLQSAALESTANAIAITDRRGAVEWVNPAFERLTGYSAAEFRGQNPRLLKSGKQDAAFYKAMWDTISAGHVWHGELVNKRKDGSFYTEEMTITPVREGSGEIAHYIAVKQDVTERKRAESALAQARDKLEQTVVERTALLVEANSNLQTFAYSAAHDLRSPLRAITSFSTMVVQLYGTSLDADGKSFLARVVGAANQMDQLLNDLLEYSRMSQEQLRLEPVDLDKAVSEALALLDTDIREKQAKVIVVGPLPKVVGHAATLALLIDNLVSNALKFMPPGVQPQIRIWTEEVRSPTAKVNSQESRPAESALVSPNSGEGATRDMQHGSALETVRLWVEDNGIGIAPEYQDKIFGVFQRLHGKQAYPGTGLGLALVRKGAERMGGRAGVESEPGKGSRFWVELRSGH